MTEHPLLRRVLAKEIEELNDGQKEAVIHKGNLVVLAGPGSGKTRTLVARVGYLLETQVPAHRGVAAITYTNHAAREIVDRLGRLGMRPGNRLASSTLHSWCLTHVLRPYSELVGRTSPDDLVIVDDKAKDWMRVLEESFAHAGVMGIPRYEKPAFTRARRRHAVGDVDEFRDPMIDAAIAFDQLMEERGWIDFDMMISRALSLLQEFPDIANLVASKFPHIVVDEYQDLGPVLHSLVTTLAGGTPVTISAFGDPDQTVMGFTGADPKYLEELSKAFHSVPLKVNYRSGQAIIAASHAVLRETRDHEARPGREDAGIIEPIYADGGLWDHAEIVSRKILQLVVTGIPAHDIAVLYPRKGPLLTSLLSAFTEYGLDFVHEKDEKLPEGEMADFIRACAARTVSGYQPPETDMSADEVRTLGDLSRQYFNMRREGGLSDFPRREVDAILARLLHPDTDGSQPELLTWFDELVSELELDLVAQRNPRRLNAESVADFRECCVNHDLELADIVVGALRTGRFTLTTYHAAKGREWQVVILPGLVDGIMPGRFWDRKRRTFPEPPPDRLAQDRLAFYVGLTRSKAAAILVYGDFWETDWGTRNTLGVSRFMRDVLAHLSPGE
ncbi:ATP-dependent helicase [Streptomyces sp. NPDC055966]|uniref:ATP-dependent helicase n=1 Tax=Streptomyces sp. NPDC055966 TaxID=3345669 RepID=UPI0035DE453A